MENIKFDNKNIKFLHLDDVKSRFDDVNEFNKFITPLQRAAFLGIATLFLDKQKKYNFVFGGTKQNGFCSIYRCYSLETGLFFNFKIWYMCDDRKNWFVEIKNIFENKNLLTWGAGFISSDGFYKKYWDYEKIECVKPADCRPFKNEKILYKMFYKSFYGNVFKEFKNLNGVYKHFYDDSTKKQNVRIKQVFYDKDDNEVVLNEYGIISTKNYFDDIAKKVI